MSYLVIKSKMENGKIKTIRESYQSRQEAFHNYISTTEESGYYRVSVLYEDFNGRMEWLVSRSFPLNKIERR